MKKTNYGRLRPGQKRRKGYQYRYKDACGWTPWLDGGDEFYGIKISAGTGVQNRAPRLR